MILLIKSKTEKTPHSWNNSKMKYQNRRKRQSRYPNPQIYASSLSWLSMTTKPPLVVNDAPEPLVSYGMSTQKTKKISNICIIIQIYVFTSLQKKEKEKRFALGITLDLRNYKAPAVIYLFPIIYYTMLICSATPNGCLGALLVNKDRSPIYLFLPMVYQINHF